MTDDLAALYQEVILDHHRAPRNCGPLPGATHEGAADNPLCGDAVAVRLLLGEHGRIDAVRWDGHGCALSRAAASLMTLALAGHTADEARALHDRLAAFLKEAGASVDDLGDLRVLAGVRAFPSRRRCALLPFEAVRAALTANR